MNKKTAREIYFDNFGNFSTMKRNGEYREYIRRKISVELEYQWSVEIKNILIDNIIGKEEFFKIVPLSRVNLPESEIIEAFKVLSLRCSKDKLRDNLEKLQKLISPQIYEQLNSLLSDYIEGDED